MLGNDGNINNKPYMATCGGQIITAGDFSSVWIFYVGIILSLPLKQFHPKLEGKKNYSAVYFCPVWIKTSLDSTEKSHKTDPTDNIYSSDKIFSPMIDVSEGSLRHVFAIAS